MMYTASMVHNKDTVTRLIKTQYNTFHIGKKVIYYILAFGLICYGLYADRTMFTPWLALLSGCLMVGNGYIPEKMTIRKVLEQIHGNYPNSEYYFEEDGFRYYNTSEIIPYKGIYRLVEDKQYLYIYTSSQSAYMVNKLTVSDGRTNNLKKYLSEKTNQVWTSPFSIWTFGFLTILQKIRSRKQSYL